MAHSWIILAPLKKHKNIYTITPYFKIKCYLETFSNAESGYNPVWENVRMSAILQAEAMALQPCRKLTGEIRSQRRCMPLYLHSKRFNKLKRGWFCLKLFTTASQSQLMEHKGHRRKHISGITLSVPQHWLCISDEMIPSTEGLKEANHVGLWVAR